MQELERRLRGRASETEEAVRKRFTAAQLEIEHYALFDYVIVNDDLTRAFDELRSIVVAEALDVAGGPGWPRRCCAPAS